MRYKIYTVLLVPFRRPELNARTLQALHNDPSQGRRPSGANKEREQLDQEQLNAPAKKEAATIR